MNWVRYLLKQVVYLIVVLFGISILAFWLSIYSPGDPVDEILLQRGIENPTEEDEAALRHELGFDRPPAERYITWLNNVLHGDLGTSSYAKVKVLDGILLRLPVTLKLAMVSMVITILFGLLFGLLTAFFKDTIIDKLISGICILLISVPGFWLALFMILIFAENLHWLPTTGTGTWKHMVMPAIVLAASTVGVTARITRSSILNQLNQQYIIVANSKGLSNRVVVFRHAFRNALIPVVTLLVTHFGNILGGATIVESIFDIPGLGHFALNAVSARDYVVLQGYVLFTGVTYVTISMILDIAYLLINPKIRLGGDI